MVNTVWQKGNYRIVEVIDEICSIADLTYELFDPELNPDIPDDKLKAQIEAFTKEVEWKGTFGYVLEKWNPTVGHGWEWEDSCYGFIGCYEEEKHYIVEEFIESVNGELE